MMRGAAWCVTGGGYHATAMPPSSSPDPGRPLPTDETPPLPTAEVRLTRQLAVASLVGLIVLGLVWELWLAPVRPGGSLLALKVLPLCIPLAGLLKNRLYTYRWVSLVVWLYFIEGVVRAWSDRAPSRWFALIEVLLCVLLFVACALHVRMRFRAQAQVQAQTVARDAAP